MRHLRTGLLRCARNDDWIAEDKAGTIATELIADRGGYAVIARRACAEAIQNGDRRGCGTSGLDCFVARAPRNDGERPCALANSSIVKQPARRTPDPASPYGLRRGRRALSPLFFVRPGAAGRLSPSRPRRGCAERMSDRPRPRRRAALSAARQSE
jgi:hypothetical protein